MTQEKLVRWQDSLLDGFKKLPPDHPIYSEGPSITFLRPQPPKHLPKLRILRGGKVNTHQATGLAPCMKQSRKPPKLGRQFSL